MSEDTMNHKEGVVGGNEEGEENEGEGMGDDE